MSRPVKSAIDPPPSADAQSRRSSKSAVVSGALTTSSVEPTSYPVARATSSG
jgi:hypothetical protein